MTDPLTLSEDHILLGHIKKAGTGIAYKNSLGFVQLLKEKEPDYTQFMQSVLGEKLTLRNDKVSNYIKQKILVSTEGLDLERKTFVKWDAKSNSFQVIKGKELFSKIKSTLAGIVSYKKTAAKRSEAKKSRVTLLERPAKSLEKQTGPARSNDIPAMTNAMLGKKDQYYGAEANKQAIRTEIVADLKRDGYTFIQEVDGVITQLSDDEAQYWIGNLYQKYKDKWTAEKPVEVEDRKCKHFTAAEDKQIIQFVESSIADGIPFKHLNWSMLELAMPHRDTKGIRQRATNYLFNDNGELIQQHCNGGKEWTNELDLALFDSIRAGENDDKVLAEKFGRSRVAIKHRREGVTFDPSGKRLKKSDADKMILTSKSLSKEYLSAAKMKPHDQLCERSLQMGCLEHGYKGNEKGYSGGVATQLVGGIKVVGPPLHQAAATVGCGPKPAPTEATSHQIEASHLCKNATCVNPKHIVWEDTAANIRRKTCVGMVRFKIGGKDIFARAKECTCNGRCLDYVTVTAP